MKPTIEPVKIWIWKIAVKLAPANSRQRDFLYRLLRFSRKHGIFGAGNLPKHGFLITESPKVSIVIPVHNQIDMTLKCLRSLTQTQTKYIYEVIVVDDASTDNTLKRLKKQSGVKIVSLDQNSGFITACNEGIKAASGEFIVFLNNDTKVEPGWLTPLIDCFADASVGIAGSKLIYPDGTLQEAGGILFSDGNAANYGRNDFPTQPLYNYVREVDYCSGASIAVRKSLLDITGGLDSDYSPAYYEDADLAMAARQEALKVLYVPTSVVTHFEGKSNGTDINSGVKAFQEINKEKFYEKWKNQLSYHFDYETVSPNRSARRLQGLKNTIIIIDDFPRWKHDAGSLRLLQIIKHLIKRGFSPVLIPSSNAGDENYEIELRNMGVLVLSEGIEANLDFISQIHNDILYFHVSRPSNMKKFFELLDEDYFFIPLIYDTIDLHFIRRERELSLERTHLSKRSETFFENSKLLEFEYMNRADITIVVSDKEKEFLLKQKTNMKLMTLPVLSEYEQINKPTQDGRSGILFVGNFNHQPNKDAVEWFVDNVYPLINVHHEDLPFYIVGSPELKHLEKKQFPQIKVMGWVDDLTEIYNSSQISIAPLRFGAGVKGKVSEAWAYGVPTVITSIAAEGMHAVSGENCLVADDPKNFADAVLNLINDKSLWEKISHNSQINNEQFFGRKKFEEDLDRIINFLTK